MKARYLHVCLIFTCLINIASADHSTVNVLDYGAKADGITDDTDAIKKAVKAAKATISEPSPIGTHYQVGPVLIFPSGEYLISDEIIIETVEIRGIGRPVIKQKNADKNIFTSRYAWQFKISDITFMGGKRQLNFYQPNVDCGEIYIEHCRFYNAKEIAVVTNVLSTTVKIEDCQFHQCYQSWYNSRCDQAVMRDCWITTNRDMKDKATIEHHGQRLTIDNMTGVPLVTPGNIQRWIDNNGSNLTVKQCRFGGEGGGFTPIYNFRKYFKDGCQAFDAGMGGSIIVDDCLVSVAGSASEKRCAVYCREFPNSIIIKNSILRSCAPIKYDHKIDLKEYFVNVPGERLHFASHDNSHGEPGFSNKIPEELKNPTIHKKPRPKLSVEQTKNLLRKIANNAVADINSLSITNGHKQKKDPEDYIDITATALFDPQKEFEVTEKKGLLKTQNCLVSATRIATDTTLVFKAKVDIDAYPWLTWKQLKGNTTGSFYIKLKDTKTKKSYNIYPYAIYEGVFDYRAENIKEMFGLEGTLELEVSWLGYGWSCDPQKGEQWDYMWAKQGRCFALEFIRFEKP